MATTRGGTTDRPRGRRWLRPSLDWLLVFVPVAVVLEHTGATAPLVFFAAAVAIVPIAGWIVRDTEQLANHTGDAVGGLLNATLGNAPELIIGVVALQAGLFEMVPASLVGAILANLLLALGVAFFTGRPPVPRTDVPPRGHPGSSMRVYQTSRYRIPAYQNMRLR